MSNPVATSSNWLCCELDSQSTVSNTALGPPEFQPGILTTFRWPIADNDPNYAPIAAHLYRLQHGIQSLFATRVATQVLATSLSKLLATLDKNHRTVRIIAIRKPKAQSQFVLYLQSKQTSQATSIILRPVVGDWPAYDIKAQSRKQYNRSSPSFDSNSRIERLLLNRTGNAVETDTANLIVQVGSRLLTPPFQTGCLPGATIQHIQQRLDIRQAPISFRQIQQASAIYICNAVIGLQPVDEVRSLA